LYLTMGQTNGMQLLVHASIDELGC
jgi:hypothetical protein